MAAQTVKSIHGIGLPFHSRVKAIVVIPIAGCNRTLAAQGVVSGCSTTASPAIKACIETDLAYNVVWRSLVGQFNRIVAEEDKGPVA